MALLRKLTAVESRTVGQWTMELVIVIAGVLIALWLQQWGERRRAIENMNAAEEAIHDELTTSLTSLLWREAISTCHLDRVALLKSMLMESGNQWPGLDENALIKNTITEETGIQMVVRGVYQRPINNYTKAAWNSALATGALAPMDRQRFARLVALYDQVESLSEAGIREDQAAATLSALSVPQEITPETRTRMLQALYELGATRFTFNFVRQAGFVDAMRELGWNDRVEIDRWIRDGEAEDRQQKTRWRPCVSRRRNPFVEERSRP